MTDRVELNSYGDLRPGTSMKCHHLAGEPRTYTVKAFYGRKFSNARKNRDTGETELVEETKGCLEFEETSLCYLTQFTNETLLVAIFGPDPRKVVGKQITLGPATDKFGREVVDAIRIFGSPELKEEKTIRVEYAKKSGRPSKTFTLVPTAPETLGHSRVYEQAITAIEGLGDAETLDRMVAQLRDHQWTRKENAGIKKAILEQKERLALPHLGDG